MAAMGEGPAMRNAPQRVAAKSERAACRVIRIRTSATSVGRRGSSSATDQNYDICGEIATRGVVTPVSAMVGFLCVDGLVEKLGHQFFIGRWAH